MFILPFDPYPLLRALMFHFDPELTHHLAIAALKHGLISAPRPSADSVLSQRVFGLDFANPLGLAAGFDKQADVIQALLNLGFGSIELGTVVPLPQSGNPKPRLFRIPECEALVNRFGFNSDGQEKILRRVAAFYEKNKGIPHAPIGINIGKNKDSADLAADYVLGIKAFAPYADYLTVNISSPNTPGLRDLQRREPLANLLAQVHQARASAARRPPLLIKIAPDQTPEQLEDIAELSLTSGIDGIIIGNTTLSRPPTLPAAMAQQAGGLSGKPLFALSTRVLGDVYRLTQGKIPLIGSGGVFSGADAYAKIRAGASLIQIYTVWIYQGPYVLSRISSELAGLLKRDGFSSLTEAVGADFPNVSRSG